MRDPAFDRVADALGREYRRALLAALLEHNPVYLEDEEAGVPLEELHRRLETQTDELAVLHDHLPRLADYGYIAWDREDNRIEKGERWDEIEGVLHLLAEHGEEYEIEWA